MTRAKQRVVAVALAAIAVAATVESPSPIAAPRQAPPPTAAPASPFRIDSLRDGMDVRRHFVRLTGTLLLSDRRRLEVDIDEDESATISEGRFRALVPLRLGENVLRVRLLRNDAGDGEPVVLAARTLRVTRRRPRPSRLDGTLDRATAWSVARNNLYLCGETGDSDVCYSQPHCVRVTRVRVDCPSTVHYDRARIGRCGEVYSVERTPGGRVLFGTYRCPYRRMPPGTAQRFVRPWVRVARSRHDAERSLDTTPHGIPAFDVFTNLMAR